MQELNIIKIEVPSHENIKDIVELDNNFFDYPWTLDQWMNLNGDFLLLSVYDASRPVGFCLFNISLLDGQAHLLKILVHPNSRNKKVATSLLAHSRKALNNVSVDNIYLEVSTLNSSAVSFYESEAFEVLCLKRRFYSNGDDAYAMQCFFK